MVRIAIFASGNGSNAENIVNYFKDNEDVKLPLIVTDNADAYVLERAKRLGLHAATFNRKDFKPKSTKKEELKIKLSAILEQYEIDYIVLAGFLSLVPEWLVKKYYYKIINIHPALLPKYGGKGMYGNKVHQAVIEAKEKISGITIHYVNENYDDGDIILQAVCPVNAKDTVESLAAKVHELEYENLPKVIDIIIKRN